MSVGLGDVINYSLEVTFYPLEDPDFPVSYWDMQVLDEKTGNGADKPVEITVPEANTLKTMTNKYVVSEDVHYIITQADVQQGAVVNQAQLSYQYKSLHSAGKLATTSDAKAEITVHASVSYKYESATPGMELPAELAALAPTDYTYHDADSDVEVQKHAASPYWDAANGGYWTLQNDGNWSSADGVESVAAGETFTMPNKPVTLTATWAFTKAPSIFVEKDGSLSVGSQYNNAKEGDVVSYTAKHTISIKNTGGEPLNTFTICDETLPTDVTGVTANIGGTQITLEGLSYDSQTHTLTVTLQGSGLAVGDTLTLSYSCERSGTLGYKTQLTDESTVDVTAVGTTTDVPTQDSAALAMQVTLQNAIILTPADIVIYAGGQTDGENAALGTNLPEPGFFVTLPLSAEQELRAALQKQEQIDLSDYLTFTDANENDWGLELFNEEYSKANGSYLYRLVPKNESASKQDKTEMQFYDEERQENIKQSEFRITNALQQEYAMTIYPGEIPAENPQAVLKMGDDEDAESEPYTIAVNPGTLYIRGTTDDLQTNAIQTDGSQTSSQAITACAADSEIKYYVNESKLTVDASNVALLVDHIVDDAYNQTLQKLAGNVIDQIEVLPEKVQRYEFRYLDLVDTSMGNTWVTASEPLEVIWPYPDGTDKDDDFTVIHYKGMDRNYDLDEMASLKLGEDYTLEVYTTDSSKLAEPSQNVTYHELTRSDNGLTFTADGFSPYVLIWQGAPESHSSGGSTPVKPQEPQEPDEPEPVPDGLNTTDHYAYLVGRGENGVQPLEPITRGEVATIWFRLLTDENRAAHWSTADCYPDVAPGSWYHNTIATITQLGVMHGDPDGVFRPEDTITRAEFVASAVRFFDAPEAAAEISFTDVPAQAWYAEAVRDGVALGLIEGDGDGTFRPEDTITRAEAAAIVNRMLCRKPHGGELLEQAAQWVDNPADAWYYEDMLEATVSHAYTWLGEKESERWTERLEERDWYALAHFGPDAADNT